MSGSKHTTANNTNNINHFIDDEEHLVSTLQVINLGSLTMVLKAVTELDVFNIMAKAGPGCQLSANEIADELPRTRNPDVGPMLDRMLRLLATHSIVTCSVVGESERRYGLTPVSTLFATDKNGASLGPLLALVESDVIRSSWNKLKDGVLQGEVPFKMRHGVSAFEYPGLDPNLNDVLNKAMFNYTSILISKFITKYKDFEDVKVLVDVGGGIGHTLLSIVSQYPSIKAINFDLPHVISNAKSHPGIQHVAGNMFESVPRGDVIFMKGIMHDWDDEHCKKLLTNCNNALPEKGKVVLLEFVLSEEPETTTAAKAISQFDVYLMNIGGKERTKKELWNLASIAGFTAMNVGFHVAHYSVIEFLK